MASVGRFKFSPLIDPYGDELYRYLNFDQIAGFEEQGRVVSAEEEAKVLAGV